MATWIWSPAVSLSPFQPVALAPSLTAELTGPQGLRI